MRRRTWRQAVSVTVVGVLLGQVGCATRGDGPFVVAHPSSIVGERDPEACEALALGEAQIAKRHAGGLRLGERERFERRAAALISEAESLGYYEGRLVTIDMRLFTVPVALLPLAVRAVALPINRAIDSAHAQKTAYQATMADCVTATTTRHGSGSDEREDLERVQALHRLGSRYLSRGRYVEAEQLYRRALAVQGRDLFPAHTAIAASLRHLVELYRGRGEHADAERLQVWLRQPGRDAPRTPVLSTAASCEDPAWRALLVRCHATAAAHPPTP